MIIRASLNAPSTFTMGEVFQIVLSIAPGSQVIVKAQALPKTKHPITKTDEMIVQFPRVITEMEAWIPDGTPYWRGLDRLNQLAGVKAWLEE